MKEARYVLSRFGFCDCGVRLKRLMISDLGYDRSAKVALYCPSCRKIASLRKFLFTRSIGSKEKQAVLQSYYQTRTEAHN